MLNRIDAIGPCIINFILFHSPRSIGDIDRTVDQCRDAGTGTAAADGHEGAKIRVLHGADAPAVDIWLNGAPGVTGLAFGEDTGYVPLDAGEYQIQVVPAGATLEEGPAVTPPPDRLKRMVDGGFTVKITAELALDHMGAYDLGVVAGR